MKLRRSCYDAGDKRAVSIIVAIDTAVTIPNEIFTTDYCGAAQGSVKMAESWTEARVDNGHDHTVTCMT